jgi:hypothetical protein
MFTECVSGVTKEFPKAASGRINEFRKPVQLVNLRRFNHTVSSSIQKPVHMVASGFQKLVSGSTSGFPNVFKLTGFELENISRFLENWAHSFR